MSRWINLGVIALVGALAGCGSAVSERPETILKDPNATDTEVQPVIDTDETGEDFVLETDEPKDTGPYSQPSIGTFVPAYYAIGARFGYNHTTGEIIDYDVSGAVTGPVIELLFVDQDYINGTSSAGICSVTINVEPGLATVPSWVHGNVELGFEVPANYSDFETDCLFFSSAVYPTTQHFLDVVFAHPWGAGVGVMDPLVTPLLSPYFTPEAFAMFGGGGGFTDVQIGAFGQVDTVNSEGFAMGGYSLAFEMSPSGVVTVDSNNLFVQVDASSGPQTAYYESVAFYFFNMQYL